MSDSTATAVTGTQRIAAAVALVAAVVTVPLAVTVAIIRFPGGLAVLACVVVAIVAAWLGVVRRGTARVVGIAVAVLALLAAVALLFRNNGWPYLVCLMIGVVISHAASRIAFRVHVRLPVAEPPRCPPDTDDRCGGRAAPRPKVPTHRSAGTAHWRPSRGLQGQHLPGEGHHRCRSVRLIRPRSGWSTWTASGCVPPSGEPGPPCS